MKKLFVTLLLLSTIGALYAAPPKFNVKGKMSITEMSEDESYGRIMDPALSIKVGSVESEYKYLNALRGPNGEQLQCVRLGSCCPFESKNAFFGSAMLDEWEITYEGLSEPIIIYLNGYDYDEPKCPVGLSIAENEEAPTEILMMAI